MRYQVTLLAAALVLVSPSAGRASEPVIWNAGEPPPGLSVDPGGVLLCIGMSQAVLECERAWAPTHSLPIPVVSGAQGGWHLDRILGNPAQFFRLHNAKLRAAGFVPNDVRVIWGKNARQIQGNPARQSEIDLMARQLARLDTLMRREYPNVQHIFHSPRIYGGYGCRLSPEPYAWDTFQAVERVVTSIRGSYLGPYMWADGARRRIDPSTRQGDGLRWLVSDFQGDGCHPNARGAAKAAAMLDAFFLSLSYDGRAPDDPGRVPDGAPSGLRVTGHSGPTFRLVWRGSAETLRCRSTSVPVNGSEATLTVGRDLAWAVRHRCQALNERGASNLSRPFGCTNPARCRLF